MWFDDDEGPILRGCGVVQGGLDLRLPCGKIGSPQKHLPSLHDNEVYDRQRRLAFNPRSGEGRGNSRARALLSIFGI